MSRIAASVIKEWLTETDFHIHDCARRAVRYRHLKGHIMASDMTCPPSTKPRPNAISHCLC